MHGYSRGLIDCQMIGDLLILITMFASGDYLPRRHIVPLLFSPYPLCGANFWSCIYPVLMKSHIFHSLRVGALFGITLSLSIVGFATDQVVEGNLSVEGDADIQGDILSLGTRADSSTTPGLNLLYTDAAAPSIYFSATRNNSSWMWQRDGAKTQMKLGGDNKLQIFDQSSTPVAKITLDPLGVSSFAGAVQFGGIVTFSGSVTTSSLHAANLHVADGNFDNITVGARLELGSEFSGINIGLNNGIYEGGGGVVFGQNNYIGGMIQAAFYRDDMIAVKDGVLGWYIEGDVRDVLAAESGSGFMMYPHPRYWYKIVRNVVVSGATTVFEVDGELTAGAYMEWGGWPQIQVVPMGGGVSRITIIDESGQELIDGEGCFFRSFLAFEQTVSVAISNVTYVNGKTRFDLSADTSGLEVGGGQLFFTALEGLAPELVTFGNNNYVTAAHGLAVGVSNYVGQSDEFGSEWDSSGAVGYYNYVGARNAYVFGSYITNNAPGSVQIGTSNEGKITISGSGALGIGTEAPTEKLDVGGDVRIRGKIRIPASGDLSMGGFTAGLNPAGE